MSNRVVKESIIDSESLAAVSAGAERLFWRLVVMGDDWGWMPGDPVVLRPRALPRLIDKVTQAEFDGWIDELLAGEKPIAELWVFDGKPFLRLAGAATPGGDPIHFTVRANKSKYAVAVALDRCTRVRSCEQLRAIVRKGERVRAVASLNGNENGNENGNDEKTSGAATAAPVVPDLNLTPPEPARPRFPKPGKGKTPNPDVKRLLDAAVAACQEHQGFRPVVRGAPEAAAMAALLVGRGYDEAVKLVREFYRDPPDWNRDQGTLSPLHIPGASAKILARLAGGNGHGRRDATGAPLAADQDDIQDTIEVDEQGVEREVRVYRDPRTHDVKRRQWGAPVNPAGSGNETFGKQRGTVSAH
jgi:hypothetical protein